MPSPMRDRVLIGAPRVRPDGTFAVPTAPGLGVEVDTDVLAEFALDA
jgi:L-alanine-DL-glutamate epimerase-like enolase superfamily enzyme